MSLTSPAVLTDLRKLISRYWGITQLRPLQEPAMQAVLAGRDSLVVLPTGGGKSLCYQAPAVALGGTTIVVSPLISLMKDQVDGLRSCGVSALQLDSTQTSAERVANLREIASGKVSLVFVSPERLIQTDLCELLGDKGVRTVAIDEAHCISHWGHDFRPEYRQLARLKYMFPQASIHAYTATATESVRRDIIEQLGLRLPEILVGDFDRPNLTYRVLPRREHVEQILRIIERNPNEGGIVYCLRRSEVDQLAGNLQKRGIKAMPYHAGMASDERKAAQDAFTTEQCDVVVATVAFGMGIDRSNVRYVVHLGMPKSVEHYQQETGRAGRDGLPSQCVLLYSGADFFAWKSIIEASASEPGVDPSFLTNSLNHLREMENYCRSASCRHAALVRYFGQSSHPQSCSACDICLGETVEVADANLIAQKILSCVARLKERFGAGHVVAVLRGENTKNIRERGHDQLSTYSLLKEHPATDVREWIYQLISQQVLLQEAIEISSGATVPILKLNTGSWQVMRGERKVRLLKALTAGKKKTGKKIESDSNVLDDVDSLLFEEMRVLRRQLAEQRHVPPYIIFSDATLRLLANVRPSSLQRMRNVYGIGDTKLRDFGEQFLKVVMDFCHRHQLDLDQQ